MGTGLLMILGVTSQRYLSIGDNGLLRGSVSKVLLFRNVYAVNRIGEVSDIVTSVEKWTHTYEANERSCSTAT